MQRISLVVALSLMFSPLLAQTHSARGGKVPKLTVKWEPATIVNGAPCLFRVTSNVKLASLTGSWFERKVFFDFDSEDGTWYGVAGVGIDTITGSYELTLKGLTLAGASVSHRQVVAVSKANYRAIALSVSRKFTELDAETLTRIKEEQALKKDIFSHLSSKRMWAGHFNTPLEGIMTEPFGTQRTFNGVRQSVHQGLDYRAEIGTPISAMNRGKVVLARELFYEGNCVAIDHGQGLLTLYLHLSELKVKEGDKVAEGQIVGLSGATGRVTGPHLHVAIRWQGIYLDPAQLIKLPLPQQHDIGSR